MYILVRQTDKVIVASAINPMSVEDASSKGCLIYEIDDAEFTPDLLGSTLDDFEVAE